MVFIEQPELHLHPRQQADLAEVIADASGMLLDKDTECFSDTYSPFVMLETHSESIALRLKKLIRSKRLDHSKVAFYYIHKVTSGDVKPFKAEVKKLPVDRFGDFEELWPNGFFEERYDEL